VKYYLNREDKERKNEFAGEEGIIAAR